MTDVTLTSIELLVASQVGSMRRVTSLKDGHAERKHTEKDGWTLNIDGAMAEMAFAKHMNIYWSAANRSFKEPDVGDWQVRSTNHPNGHLIIRPNDTDGDIRYALVVTNPPCFSIAGFMLSAEARTNKYWRQDSWWVPQSELTKM